MPSHSRRDAVLLHRELWAVVTGLLEPARPLSRQEALTVLLFSYHTLEAYVNYVGALLNPDLWQIERTYFRSPPYQGLDGKLRKLFELLGRAEPSRLERPYAAVWKLKAVHDGIVHSNPARLTSVILNQSDALIRLRDDPFQGMATGENALQAAEDIRLFIHVLHAEARLCLGDDTLPPDPLSPIDPFGAMAHVPPQ